MHEGGAEIERLRALTWWMDRALRIPGTPIRLGLDALIGLVPGIGDLAGGAISAWFLVAGARLGAPPAVLARMGLNAGVDALVGAVPVLGDLFDFGWKANARNLALLERHLADPRGTRRRSTALLAGVAAALLLALAGALAAAVWIAARVVGWAAGLV